MMTNYEKIKNMTVEEIANYLKAKDCPISAVLASIENAPTVIEREEV